jgi:hypothetical protein
LKNFKRISRLALSAFVAVILFSACKESTTISANQVPVIDSINTIELSDSLHTIYTKTILIDTLNTSANITGVNILHALGTVVDPYFGRTNAGIYFQVLPPSSSFNFSADVDSAFIILPLSPIAGYVWGDSINNRQRYTAYRISEEFKKDNTYLSNQQLQVINTPITEPYSVTTEIFDSVSVLGTKRHPHIRLKLKKEFVDEIKQTSPSLPTSADFINFLKGIYIAPDENLNSGALPYIMMDGPTNFSRAAIEFYYTENGAAKNTFFNFVRGETAHLNWIQRKYTPQVLDIATKPNSDILLLQNQPGAAIDVIIPSIKDLPIGIVNTARLILTKVSLAGQADDKFTAPDQLIIYGVDQDGKRYLTSEGVEFNDGKKRTVTVNGLEVTQYYFNIPAHIQKAISQQWNTVHLRILGAQGRPGAYRLIAGGRDYNVDKNYRLQLKIYYSKPQ